jgi:hypothetical protein
MVNNIHHRKAATVTNVYETYVVVSTGPTKDQVEILSGKCKPRFVKVGDVGNIIYVTTRNSGLWYWEE